MIIFVVLVALTYFLKQLSSFDISWLTLLPVTLYLLVRSIRKGQILFFISYSIFLFIQFEPLLMGIRLLVNEGIMALAKWGWLLPLQEVHTNDASLVIGLLLVCVSLLFSKRTLWVLVIVSIGLPFFLQQPFHMLSFALLVTSCLTAIYYVNYHSLSIGHTLLAAIFCCIVIPFPFISGFQQIGEQLVQEKNQLQYGANEQTQLANGQLSQLSSFERTATPAFKIAMEHPMPLYLKSYIGARYQNDWTSIEEDLLQDATIQQHLQEAQYFQQTQFAQAAQTLKTNTISIQPFGMSRKIALTPYELATSVQDFTIDANIWHTKQLFGSSSYTYQITDRSYTEYPAIASALYQADDSPYLKLEGLHNYLSYRYYVDLPQETRTILQNHFEVPEHQTYEQTIATVQEQLATITYNENPKKANGDFVQFLLEESKEGYSIHYATLATLLFRASGIPARYVEGYILTTDDVSERKEMTVTSDSRHAWTEIYIDWLGWIPIEVTPGYTEKMPTLAQTDFEQDSSPTQSPTNAAPTISQIAPPTFEDNPVAETKDTTYFPYFWLLGLLVLPLITWWIKQRKHNQMQHQFMKLIHTCNKKWVSALPVHQVIYKINTAEALEAYQLYNVMMYQQQPLTAVQKKNFKQLLNVVKKQIKEEA